MDTDENKSMAQKFQIDSYPTLIAFKDGTQMDKFVGNPFNNELDQFLQNVAAKKWEPYIKSIHFIYMIRVQ